MQSNKITIRADEVLHSFSTEFKSVCSEKAFRLKIQQLKSAGSRSSRPGILHDLYDMFTSCGIPFEKDKTAIYYEELVNTSHLPDFEELENKIIRVLYSSYDTYPSPEDYMLRIVNRMSTGFLDNWENSTLRLRILRQFIKYGNYLSAAGFRSRQTITKYARNISGKSSLTQNEVCECVDDGIFSLLDSSAKEDRKPDGRLGLLRLADDLASGNFRAGGASKRGLYMFAMAYGMTYGQDNDSADIEKNLFQDYYTNNLMRFICMNNNGGIEADPSGQGINYKNFAEMVYLYFIAQNTYSPIEKIELSSGMIDRLRDSSPSKNTASPNFTGIFRTQIQNIFRMPPEKFEAFLRDNYNCFTGGTKGVLQLETEHNTALKIYTQILSKCADIPERNCEGLWFTDVEAFTERQYENLRAVDDDDKKIREFTALLEAANSFLSRPLPENPPASEVTRTMIITAYYYYFTALHENDSSGTWDSFGYLFYGLKNELDPMLSEAGCQTFSSKIIFDVLTAFSAWAYLNY